MPTPQELFDSDMKCAQLAGMTVEAAGKYAQELALRRASGSVTLTETEWRERYAAAWDHGYRACREGLQQHNPYRLTPSGEPRPVIDMTNAAKSNDP